MTIAQVSAWQKITPVLLITMMTDAALWFNQKYLRPWWQAIHFISASVIMERHARGKALTGKYNSSVPCMAAWTLPPATIIRWQQLAIPVAYIRQILCAPHPI